MPPGSSSLVNKVEAEMLLCVFQQFMRKLPELTQRPATAIITPYKAQVRVPARPAGILLPPSAALKRWWSRRCTRLLC
jgi:hypothetical protein